MLYLSAHLLPGQITTRTPFESHCELVKSVSFWVNGIPRLGVGGLKSVKLAALSLLDFECMSNVKTRDGTDTDISDRVRGEAKHLPFLAAIGSGCVAEYHDIGATDSASTTPIAEYILSI